jgi:molybdopterin/thiamine biosynthesis adenylyltransferase
MIALRPRLHELVGSSASRTITQLEEMGVAPSSRQVRVGIRFPSSSDPARQLLAETLVDLLLRLDPLVGEVVIDMGGSPDAWLADLATKVPFERLDYTGSPDYAVGVGDPSGGDLLVDGAGWLAAVGATAPADDSGIPVGPLGAATLAAAEVFKWTFGQLYPDRAAAMQFTPWAGVFSLFSYEFDSANLPLGDLRIDTTLVGLGGVGAGFVRAMVALGARVSGRLTLVDADVLTTDNLNRVSYASLSSAGAGSRKVHEALRVLNRHCPNLTVAPRPSTFAEYKSQIPRRQNRVYDVIVTGLDSDESRWEVQRDLPRILIDGATGRDMNTRIERVEFGRYGCLGCSRQGTSVAAGAEQNCDAPPDVRAPSLSFLSSFPGILAAGEVIKEAAGSGQLRGGFDHIFRYGPNPDQRGTPAIRLDCSVQCGRASKIAQYRAKYPSEDSRTR